MFALHALAAATAAGERAGPPPIFRIRAATHFDAGLQHGRLASALIQGWLATEEMRGLVRFVEGDGKDALANVMRDNTKFAPHLAEELRGIAEGAGVPLPHIWVANSINELESLQDANSTTARRAGHCSDLYAVPAGGTAAGFAHGHNEDWPGPIRNFWYLLAVNATTPSHGLSSCAGMIYPGGLPGWASTWNAHGIFLTQNSLFPATSRRRGLISAFVQRQVERPA